MERSQLLYVVEVAKQSNITRAAEVLHLSQPSLSNQILALERELGVSLFERTRKGVSVTEAGESFVYQATHILNDLDALRESMTDFAQRRAGRVRVGALPIMVALGVPEAITAFCRQYPALQLTLQEEGSFVLVNKIRSGEVDAGFVVLSDTEEAEDLYQIPLMRSCIVAAVHAASPLAQKAELCAEDFRDQTLVLTSESFNMQRLIMTELDRQGIPFRIGSTCSQIETCFRLVDQGFGISFCSEQTSQYYHFEHVRYIPIQEMPLRQVVLVYRKNPAYHPALQAFVMFMRDRYQKS